MVTPRQQVALDVKEAFDDPGIGDIIRPGSITRVVTGAYDPATQAASVTTTTYPCRVLWSSRGTMQSRFGNDLALEPSDKICYIEGLSVEPKIADRILVDGTTYDVLLADDSSAGTGALWLLVVR